MGRLQDGQGFPGGQGGEEHVELLQQAVLPRLKGSGIARQTRQAGRHREAGRGAGEAPHTGDRRVLEEEPDQLAPRVAARAENTHLHRARLLAWARVILPLAMMARVYYGGAYSCKLFLGLRIMWGDSGREPARGGSGSEPEAPNPLGSPQDPEGGAGKGQKEKANAAGARPRVPDEATPRPALPPLRPGR